MRFVLTADPEEFAAHAGELIERRPHDNILATVLLAVREGRLPAASARFAYGTTGGTVRAAALRTAPGDCSPPGSAAPAPTHSSPPGFPPIPRSTPSTPHPRPRGPSSPRGRRGRAAPRACVHARRCTSSKR